MELTDLQEMTIFDLLNNQNSKVDAQKSCAEPKNVATNGTAQHEPGAKLDAGKPIAGVLGDFSLALTAIAEVGTFGANKYTRGGWQSVPNGVERYTDAAWRHLLKESRETNDNDSGLSHAAHLAWNILARLELILRDQAK